MTGNRCDHNASDPRWLGWGPSTHWGIVGALAQTHRLYDERNAGIYMGREGRSGLLYGARSEHAEAVQLVAQCLIRRMRIGDLRIASKADYTLPLSVAAMMRETSLSVDRVHAALRTMRSKGWLRGFQEKPDEKKPDGSHKYRVKIRWLTYSFFRTLGAAVVRTLNRARGKSPTYQATEPTPATPATPPATPPADPRDTWPDD